MDFNALLGTFANNLLPILVLSAAGFCSRQGTLDR